MPAIMNYDTLKSMGAPDATELKIYMASHDPEDARTLRDLLLANDTMLTMLHRPQKLKFISRWMDQPFYRTSMYQNFEKIRIAVDDVEDVIAADVLILVAGPEKYSGGKFFEAGIAFGMNKPVIIYGRRENMLMWHPKLLIAETSEEVLGYLVTISHIRGHEHVKA